MEVEWDTIETSVGPLSIKACARDYLNITSPKENPSHPFVLATVKRKGDGWEIHGPSYSDAVGKMPAGLGEELLRLGIAWAEAHPKDFELAGDEKFRNILSATADWTFEEILDGLKLGQKDLKSILEEPEFKRRASVELVHRIKKESQRIRVMRTQIAGAAKAIKTLADKCLANEVA
jgi:hypothetical protein